MEEQDAQPLTSRESTSRDVASTRRLQGAVTQPESNQLYRYLISIHSEKTITVIGAGSSLWMGALTLCLTSLRGSTESAKQPTIFST